MLLLLALLLPLQDAELDGILKRFEADEPSAREAASKDLDALVSRLGAGAAGFLKSKLPGTRGEVRSRLQEKLNELVRIEDLRNRLAFFDHFEMPSVKDLRLVILNTGETSWSGTPDNISFDYQLGWVVNEHPNEMTLLGTGLEPASVKRNRSSLKDWERVREKQPKDYPPPGECRDADFAQMCRDLMAATTTDATHGVGFFHRSSNAWGLGPALFAYWCLQRELPRTAFELFELGESAWRAQARDERRPYAEELVDRACEALRYIAVDSAKPRAELLKQWRKIEKLNPKFRDGECMEMIPLYAQMIEEDAARKPLSAAEVEKLAPAARVEHWMYYLRDVAARQWSDPGSCHVLFPYTHLKKEKAYPPVELVKLGWDVIPALIEHLDDRRPTRSVGWHRSFNTRSYYLLRVGDCCEQVFRAITGMSIYEGNTTSSAMVKDGDAQASKNTALKWWAEVGKEGAENYYISALEKPGTASTAATKLLSMHGAKHVPRLLAIMKKGSSGSRRGVVEPLEPFLQKEHQVLLESALGDPDPETVTAIARVLWSRFASDRGGLEMIARLKAVSPEEKDPPMGWSYSSLLSPMRTDAVARGVVELLRSPNLRIRNDAFDCAGSLPDLQLAQALVEQLDDKTSTGWTSSYEIRFCDRAAEALARMAGLREQFALKGSDEERDRTIGGLKVWWRKDGAALDWGALRKKIDDAEHRTPVKD